MTPRLRAASALTLALLLSLGIALTDAALRRDGRDDARQDAVVALVGMSDLALSSSARWLRHPSQAEPGAAFSDLPASLDVDPAGAWIGPPRAVLSGGSPTEARP